MQGVKGTWVVGRDLSIFAGIRSVVQPMYIGLSPCIGCWRVFDCDLREGIVGGVSWCDLKMEMLRVEERRKGGCRQARPGKERQHAGRKGTTSGRVRLRRQAKELCRRTNQVLSSWPRSERIR